jgi:predicted MFS family arabinose efflux permease
VGTSDSGPPGDRPVADALTGPASTPGPPATAAATAAGTRLTNRLVAVMAVATGAIVANLYYAQPLLHRVAATFHVGSAAAALVITCTQVGYAAGLLLVVPLGDLYARRVLVVVVFCLAGLSLVVCALAPGLLLFEAGSVAVGAASVAGQVMIPFAADLAEPARRGRVVARLMSGLLLGILLARTVSGLVAQLAGWRAIYWVSAALMAVFALVLARILPREPRRPHVPYWGLVGTSVQLLWTVPMLRRRAWHGATVFGAFSVLWTSLAFLLSGPPYHYSNAAIGLFGLAGVAGVAAANVAGRLADAHRTPVTTVASGLLVAGSFALLAAGRTSLAPLLVGIVVLDLGTQGMQITNQAVIYSLRPEARSRINSAYMFCYFVGGAAGSILAGTVLAAGGWDWDCVLGGGFGALSLVMAGVDRLRPAPAGATPAAAGT